jgi:hypothetical protein
VGIDTGSAWANAILIGGNHSENAHVGGVFNNLIKLRAQGRYEKRYVALFSFSIEVRIRAGKVTRN